MPQNDSVIVRQKQFGVCSVCFRQLSITSSGAIHSHGLHGSQCAWSGVAPTSGAVTAHPSSTTSQQIQASVPAIGSEQTLLSNLFGTRTPVLKYVPKATQGISYTSCGKTVSRIGSYYDRPRKCRCLDAAIVFHIQLLWCFRAWW